MCPRIYCRIDRLEGGYVWRSAHLDIAGVQRNPLQRGFAHLDIAGIQRYPLQRGFAHLDIAGIQRLRPGTGRSLSNATDAPAISRTSNEKTLTATRTRK